MSLQSIRRFFEKPIAASITSVDTSIKVLTDNQTYVDNDAAAQFALIRVSFGNTAVQTFCEPMERIEGAIVIELYTPKGEGPGRAQALATAITRTLYRFPRHKTNRSGERVSGRINNVSGPSFTPLDGKPHLLTRLSCGFQADYS